MDKSDWLYMCPAASPGCANCHGCPCAEAHTLDDCKEWDEVWGTNEDLGCPDCEPIDQFVYDELYPGDPNAAYGDISPHIAAYAVKRLLEESAPSFFIKNFGGSKSLPKNKPGHTIKFRRYSGPGKNSPLTPGIVPTASSLSYDTDGGDLLDRAINKTKEKDTL